jgi:hypothetical protein
MHRANINHVTWTSGITDRGFHVTILKTHASNPILNPSNPNTHIHKLLPLGSSHGFLPMSILVSKVAAFYIFNVVVWNSWICVIQFYICLYVVCWDRSFSIVTKLWAGLPAGMRDLSVFQNIQTGCGAHPFSSSKLSLTMINAARVWSWALISIWCWG